MGKSDSTLTTGEQKKLAQLEETIENGLKSFYDVGCALLEIKTSGLFTDIAPDFEGYCKKRWNIAKSRAYQLIDAAKVVDAVSTIGGKSSPPMNERQARILAECDTPQQQADVWAKAIETAPEGNDGKPKITAAHVAKVKAEVLGEKEPDPEPEEEAEPEPLKDDLDRRVPDKLIPAFSNHQRFLDIRAAINDVKKLVKELADLPGGEFINAQAACIDLDNAKREVMQHEPYTTCPYCKGKGCQACKGAGFVPKLVYDNAPGDKK